MRRRDLVASAAAAPVVLVIAVVAAIVTLGPPFSFETALDGIAVADEEHRKISQAIVIDAGAGAVAPLAAIVERDGPPRDVTACAMLSKLARAGIDLEAATDALASALREGRPDIARAAAATLATGRGEAAVRALLATLRESPDPERRRAAADALGEAREGRGVRALLDGYEDPEVAVRARAALWSIIGEAPDLDATSRERADYWSRFAATLPTQVASSE